MNNIAIIGSAGRQDDASRIDGELYKKMTLHAEKIVFERNIRQAISGGAALSDHVAVSLYLNDKVDFLTLFMPAIFYEGKYVAKKGVEKNTALTANAHHKGFHERCGVDGLQEITEAIKKGAKVEFFNAFKRRNLEVAAIAKNVLAFTFGKAPTCVFSRCDRGFSSAKDAGLKNGGTAHTWDQAWKADWKNHVNLSDFES